MENNKQPQESVYQYDEINRRLRSRQKFFRPLSLRTPVLSALLAATIILIILTEIACRKLPNSGNRGVIASLNNDTSPVVGRNFAILKRQDKPNIEITTIQTVSGVEETIVVEQSWITTTTPAPPPITECSTDVELSTLTCTTIQPPQATSAAPGNYLIIGTRTIGRKSSPAPTPTPTPIPIGAPTPIPSENPQPTPEVANSPVAMTPVAPITSILPETVDVVGNYVPPVTIVETPVATVAPVTPPYTTIPPSFSSESKSSRMSTPTKGGNTVVISGSTIVLLPTDVPTAEGSEDVVYYFSKRDYILGAFLPTIIAVLFSIPWGIVNTAAKEIEPYVRLAGDDGASARVSLCLDYPGDFLIATPFKSFFRGHWIIFLTSTMNLISLLLAPLASESVFISLQGTCNADTAGDLCIPTLSVYPPAARVLQTVLAILALFLIFVVIFARRRSTGVYANPHSLAAVATLFHHPHLTYVLRKIPSATLEKHLAAFLEAHKYELGYYQNEQGTAYGVLANPEYQTQPEGYTHIDLNEGGDPVIASAGNNTRKMKRAAQVMFFMLAIAALTAVVSWYRFSSSDNVVFRFMESQSFGVRFVFTSFGVLIRLFWDYTRTAIHKHEPYYNLKKGAPAASTILLAPSPNALPGMFWALRRLAIFQFVIDLSTVLCDPLTVSLANVPFSSGMTYETFIICVWISISILGFMLLTLFVVLVRIGRFGGEVKVPSTLGGKMRLLAGSGLAERFRDLADMDTETRDEVIKGWGLKYKIGVFTGVDGVRREGVDCEEFVDN
ncbi:hypothetical protein VTL71DRAFT_10126 [Oculimacula yallundae]|uniref:Uncharacterized protein n=1 Tax=Oculimacula yallundae TaxID=86028 RepID=A0ABR4BS86_9HELO